MKWNNILMVLLTVLYCIITLNFVVHRHVKYPGQSLINDNFTVVTG